MNSTKNNTVNNNFSTNFKWNVSGSIFYEISKIIHQVFLLKTMTTTTYGLMGSLFALIYITIYLSEFGFSQTLPAFLNIFIKNKQNFKNLFIKKYICPQILIFISTGTIFLFFYKNSLFNTNQSPFILLLFLLIVFEGLRIFFRRFLHNIFISKPTIIIETILIIIYFASIWIPYFFFKTPMTLNLIFIPYLINSFISLTGFIIIINKFYNRLPKGNITLLSNFQIRILKNRFFNYVTHITKHFFTGNFLTPFFASIFGLSDAGIFNLAYQFSESIKAIMKVTIIFSGGALLAKLKTTSIIIKRKAFNLLGYRLNKVVYPIVIFLIINHKILLNFKGIKVLPPSTIYVTLLFLLITLMEYLFIAYEQFYIIEENVGKLFIFKLLEFLMFYVIIISKNFTDPIPTLFSLLIIRLLSFAIIATNAYVTWKIKPTLKIANKYLISVITISTIFYLLFKQ